MRLFVHCGEGESIPPMLCCMEKWLYSLPFLVPANDNKHYVSSPVVESTGKPYTILSLTFGHANLTPTDRIGRLYSSEC